MVLIYPVGVPASFLLTLSQHRSKLDPPGVPEAKVLEMRDFEMSETPGASVLVDKDEQKCATKELFVKEPITAFARPYRPQYWYFEAYIMLRRILLTSGSLCFDDLSSMIVFVLMVSIVTLVFEDQAKPHTNKFLSAFCYCMSWQVLLCILMLLLLDAKMTSKEGAMVISAALLITNIGLVAIVLKDTKTKEKRSQRELKLQKFPSSALSQLREDDETRA
eukprot:CAMPEP_0205919036 /NCGR_PEP_ID=MMETSP1325-20131115/10179_1 /ASSEMBLY_ACC=CAM_ASM_000708 /TAXON_ID=236786 /ORGANISM="Florenciella sp., Strain RCC1007" /LENGTH=219 /DNA_ID=CAMNT_0053286613 /DNA_START=1 /DNA_END=656 /DNA_ORIENTATION=+